MHGLTDYITECDWEDVVTVWLVLVDDTFKLLYPRLRASGPAPTFADRSPNSDQPKPNRNFSTKEHEDSRRIFLRVPS